MGRRGDEGLTPIKQAQIIQYAMMAGVAVFVGLVLLMAYQKGANASQANEQALSFLRKMTFFHAFLFMVTWSASQPLRLVVEKNAKVPENATPEKAAILRWQAGRLIELALREGAAFFGLVVCVLGIQNGALAARPIYWVNALSAILFLLYAAVTFPRQQMFSSRTLQDSV
jgi:hypothetical protein